MSNRTAYRISNQDQCIWEIQSVGTSSISALDHTMEVAKNYQKGLGAVAVWDCAMETGEIASAIIVGSTKICDLAHAAKCLARCPNFKPTAMYSDTWPNKDGFWKLLFGEAFQGRLGLFHYQQRIIKTLQQGHIDYRCAIKELCDCVYEWEEGTYQALLKAHKEGKMGLAGEKALSNCNIIAMQESPVWQCKYSKFLMK
ncbi:hypothetical protein ACA910_014752 [Epithemia clementina (nom. ined.)]